LNAGIHAREWIANAVATYMIRELVENYEQNKDLVDNLNFHILPLANPDGYEYSRSTVSLFYFYVNMKNQSNFIN
jgi:murein tripeptide amidase MpaA